MKIDILMATYNGEKYLREQIDSILNQTYSDFKLLISDDFSQDSTREILHEYAKKDDRVIVFLQNENLGVTKNFEFLMKKVENEYFMFADQDDFWQKDKIQKSIEKMHDEDCDLVYTNLEVVNQDLKLVNESYWKLKGFEKKISIFAPEGTRLLLKHKNEGEDIEIHIGSTGMYEIEDIQIVSLKFLDNSSSEIIIDYILFIKI